MAAMGFTHIDLLPIMETQAMNQITKIRAKRREDGRGLLVMTKHAYAIGSAQSPNASWIEQMSFEMNGKTIAEVFFRASGGTSPLTIIAIDDATAGDVLTVHWHDSRGDSGDANTIAP